MPYMARPLSASFRSIQSPILRKEVSRVIIVRQMRLSISMLCIAGKASGRKVYSYDDSLGRVVSGNGVQVTVSWYTCAVLSCRSSAWSAFLTR